ncbi:CHASE2 domain-containing protein [Nisaea sp.]|uniref:CHASE2 domain-containing protein n=1 Tax=Nisaea sp. TaxID=2024842 RepID=UPI0032EAEACA
MARSTLSIPGLGYLFARRGDVPLILLVPVLVLVLDFFGLLAPLDRTLVEQRFRLLSEPASGEVVVVEIDPDTIGFVGTWPFPRQVFADLITRLDAAGARTIALDIDFSARSTAEDDALLKAAIAGSNGRVILPYFEQRARRGDDAATVDRQALQFAEGTGSYGGVNVTPEADSLIWNHDAFALHGETKRPSLAMLVAEGQVTSDRFMIDYGISYESIPHLSMRAVLEDAFDPARIAGRRVMVGAAAIELGDHLPVPRYGYLPGVYVQAIATESLIKGRALQSSTGLVTAAGLLLLLPLGVQIMRRRWQVSILLAAVSGLGILGLAVAVQATSILVLNIAGWLLALAGWWLVDLVRTLHEQAIRLFRQRMSGTYRRELMRRVVDDSFDGIVMSDSLGRIESVNATAARIIGVDGTKMLGRPIGEILTPELFREIWGRIQADLTGEPFDVSIPQPDGPPIDTEMVISTLRLAPSKRRIERRRNDRRVHVITFRDISERKAAEDAKTVALGEANRANQAKSQFLANVSHELRTPLNAILGFSDLIRSQVFGAIGNQRYVEYIESINYSGTLLLELIDSILDISCMESGESEMKPEIFDIGALLDECKAVMGGLIAKSPRILTVEVDSSVSHIHADRSLMRQVFVNLLTNAFKFTDESGEIGVFVRQTTDREVVIEVTDNGFGIPEDERSAIFEPFHQTTGDYVRKTDGFGLGLFIVDRIVSGHGGRIEVESELDAGTTIRILLPKDCVVSRSDFAHMG